MEPVERNNVAVNLTKTSHIFQGYLGTHRQRNTLCEYTIQSPESPGDQRAVQIPVPPGTDKTATTPLSRLHPSEHHIGAFMNRLYQCVLGRSGKRHLYLPPKSTNGYPGMSVIYLTPGHQMPRLERPGCLPLTGR